MLRFVSSQNPVVIIFLIAYAFILRLKLFIYPGVAIDHFAQSSEPLSVIVYELAKALPLNTSVFMALLAVALVVVQALLLNNLLIKHKLYDQANYLPALIYILISSLFGSFLSCSPALLSTTFIILAFEKLFESFKLEKALENAFDAGLYIGIASLFYFPSLLFIAYALIALILLRPVIIREHILLICGVLTPYVLAFTYYFWIDQPTYLWTQIVLPNTSAMDFNIQLTGATYFGLFFVLVLLIWSLASLPAKILSSLIQFRKFTWMVLTLMLIAVIASFMTQVLTVNHFILLAFPVSILVYHVFDNLTSRPILGESLHICMFAGILLFQYLG